MESLKSEHYEFLDLTEVDDSERNRLNESLFGSPQPEYLLQFPWTPANMSQSGVASHQVVYPQRWDEHYGDNEQSIDGDRSPSSCVTSDSSGIMSPHSGVGVVPPPNMYTQPPPPIYQNVPQHGPGFAHHPPNVFVSNVTANVNLHGYVSGPYMASPQAYSVPATQIPADEVTRSSGNSRGRHRQRNVSRHRQNEIEQPVRMNPSGQYVPPYMAMPSYATTYFPPPHSTAQHAAGSPMYLTPIYPSAIYGGYPSPGPNTLVYPGPGMHITAEYPYPGEAQIAHNVSDTPQENAAYQQGAPSTEILSQQTPIQSAPPSGTNGKADVPKMNGRKSMPNKPYTQTEIKQCQEPVEPQHLPVNTSSITDPNKSATTNGEAKQITTTINKTNTHVDKIKKTPPPSSANILKTNNSSQRTINPPVEVTRISTNKTQTNVGITSVAAGKTGFNSRKTIEVTTKVEVDLNIETLKLSSENDSTKSESKVNTITQVPIAAHISVKRTPSNGNKTTATPESCKAGVKSPQPTKVTTNITSSDDVVLKTNTTDVKNSNQGPCKATTEVATESNAQDFEICTVVQNVLNNEKVIVGSTIVGTVNKIEIQSGSAKVVPLENQQRSEEKVATLDSAGGAVTATTAPSKGSSSTNKAVDENSNGGGGKSWASLFSKEDRVSVRRPVQETPVVIGKPLARVSPFGADNSANKEKQAVVKPQRTEVTKVQKASPTVFLNDPNSYRMGEFLTKYRIDNRTVSLLPRGFTNRSNYCYVNSILQALMACPPFYNLIRALPQQFRNGQKSSTPVIDSMIDLVNEFNPLPAGARVGRREKTTPVNGNNQQHRPEGLEIVNCGPALEPSCIYRSLHAVRSEGFSVEGRQEDAEEFLGCFLNSLNDEMLELVKLVDDDSVEPPVTNGVIAGSSAGAQGEDEWKVMGPKNKGSITRRMEFGRSPISDIFRGQLRCRVQRAGDQSTDNVQPFFTLQLDIEKANSVKEALEMFVGKDRLEGVTCSRTQQAIEAWQQVSLEELPLVLLLHLKCFHYERDTCSKIIKTVEFPVDLKIDAKLMSANKKYTNKQKQYKLFAVVYHDGKEATKGHYITDAFHVGYGGWVRYDDSSVKGVTEAQVLRPRAPRMPYLLYYRRCDTIGNHGVQSTNNKKE